MTPEVGSVWERNGERRMVQHVYADGPVLVSFAYAAINCRSGTGCWILSSWNEWVSGATMRCGGLRDDA